MTIGLSTRRITMLPGQPAPEPIRLQTLILLRWVAVIGQLLAVAGALFIGVSVPLLPVLLVVTFAILSNTWLMLRPLRRVSEQSAAIQLGFDLAQITILIGLTGGMTNPFALLVLVPVTIAATTLPTRYMVALGITTLLLVTAASVIATPLSFENGSQLALDMPYQLGHWVAIVIGVVFLSTYAHRVSSELEATSDALFVARMALEREQKLQHLGGVVAAAAHEMGTPLGTIKLISKELSVELADMLPERSDIADDLAILRQSADRCGEILKSMGRAGKDDLMIRTAPLLDLLQEAAAPHKNRGVSVQIDVEGEADLVHRDAAIVHGLRNLIQNAVDFAKADVEVTATWSADVLKVSIADDGPGYPAALLPRLGSPFLTSRARSARRGGHEGMGLGLFIAKALLERSGARLDFSNSDRGAEVVVIWPRSLIEAESRKALGANPEIEE